MSKQLGITGAGFIAGISFIALLGIVIFLAYFPHKDDQRLRAECEEKGGVLVHAKDPLHICVETPK